MKKTNILIKSILMCFALVSTMVKAQNSQEVSNGNFELGESGVNNSNYTVFYDFGTEINCNNTNFSNYTTLDYIHTNDFLDPATLININPLNINDPSNFDPHLLQYNISLRKTNQLSAHSLKLNRTNEHNCGNCNIADSAILEKTLSNVSEEFLSLNFAMVFSKPNTSSHIIARFEILSPDNNIIVSECLTSNDNLVQTVPSNNTLKYIDWNCLTLDLSGLKRYRNNGKLRIIVSDFDKGNDTIMYLDDIGNNGILCEPEIPCEDGIISMNSLSINCPKEPFKVSGNYTLPSCDASDPTSIKLNLIPSNSSDPVTVDENNFSGGFYSFTINPNDLDSSLEYDIQAIANFSDGSSQSVSNIGTEITFKDCDEPCVGPGCDVECEDFWVAILDEYIDGTQGGSNYVYLMANGNYPTSATYDWTTTRQNGLVQTYSGSNIILVAASANNRIVSATVTVTYENCSETVRKRFACAIPNADANGNLFPECNNSGGGFGRSNDEIKIYPNPANSNSSIKINGIDNKQINAIEVLDMSGNIKLILKQKTDTIKLDNLKSGVYFIKISTKQGVIQKKVIVN